MHALARIADGKSAEALAVSVAVVLAAGMQTSLQDDANMRQSSQQASARDSALRAPPSRQYLLQGVARRAREVQLQYTE